MNKIKSTLHVCMLSLVISSTTFAGNIGGMRTDSSRSGNIGGLRTERNVSGNIGGLRYDVTLTEKLTLAIAGNIGGMFSVLSGVVLV